MRRLRKTAESGNTATVVDVTGAVDAFVSGFVHGILNEETVNDAIKFGQYNAAKTLQSERSVRADLTVDELIKWKKED